MGAGGWEPQCIRPPLMRVFVDAAINAEGSADTVGVWGPRGPAIRRVNSLHNCGVSWQA